MAVQKSEGRRVINGLVVELDLENLVPWCPSGKIEK
jgi:hypothetical protein